MAVDLNFSLLTDASRNFGNALTSAASTIHDRRKESVDRAATANYLNNPTDPKAFQAAVQRNPAQAMQIQDHHLEAARSLRTDQQQQLDYVGQLLGPVYDLAQRPGTTPEQLNQAYQQAVGLARQGHIDVTGHETYDPNYVSGAVQLHRGLHPVAPVSVGPGARLINPQTGAQVAEGAPERPRYYPVQNRLILDPSYTGPTTGVRPGEDAAPPQGAGQPPPPHEIIADGPHGPIRLNPQTQQWEPLGAGGSASAPGSFPREDYGAFDFNAPGG